MTNFIKLTFFLLLFFVWTVIKSAMSVITSDKSVITRETLNNRWSWNSPKINEMNAEILNEALKEI